MDIIFTKEQIGRVLTLDWCTKEHFIERYINNQMLFNNRKDNLFIAKGNNAIEGIDATLESNHLSTFVVSFSLLLFNRQEFEDFTFEGQTLQSVSELKQNVIETKTIIQSFVAVPSTSFVPLRDYSKVI